MFERTALPDGPRVISARLPGTRSLSVAVYVLVGSRQETRRTSGLAHFMEHITFKGTRDLPDDARGLRGHRGRGRHLQRGHGPGDDGLLDAAARARGGAGRPRPGRADAAAAAAQRGHRPRARHHRRRDPLLPRRPRPVRLQRLGRGLLRRHAAGLGDRRRRGDRARAERRGHPRLLGRPLPAVEPRRGGRPATSPTRTSWRSSTASFGRGGARRAGVPARAAAPVERLRTLQRETSQAYVCLGARRPAARPRRPVDARPAQHGPRGRHVVAPLHGHPRGGRPRLRRALLPDRLR